MQYYSPISMTHSMCVSWIPILNHNRLTVCAFCLWSLQVFRTLKSAVLLLHFFQPWGHTYLRTLGTVSHPGGHIEPWRPQSSLGGTIIPGGHNYPWGHFLLYNGQTHVRMYTYVILYYYVRMCVCMAWLGVLQKWMLCVEFAEPLGPLW